MAESITAEQVDLLAGFLRGEDVAARFTEMLQSDRETSRAWLMFVSECFLDLYAERVDGWSVEQVIDLVADIRTCDMYYLDRLKPLPAERLTMMLAQDGWSLEGITGLDQMFTQMSMVHAGAVERRWLEPDAGSALDEWLTRCQNSGNAALERLARESMQEQR